MGVILVLWFLTMIGPMVYFYGVDSRRSTDRGWFGSRRALYAGTDSGS